jgi:tetratricopeptide (TPR) repeat protein
MKFFMKFMVFALLLSQVKEAANASVFLLAPSDSFRLEGTIKSNEKGLPGATLNIYLNNVKLKSAVTNRYGIYNVYLQHNKEYVLEAVKEGYISVKIDINTKISDAALKKGGISEAIDVNIETYEYYPQVKIDVFSKPVETFVFDEKSWYFNSDPKKSKAAQVKPIVTKIVQIRTKAGQDAAKRGLALYNKKTYDAALVEYCNAVEMNTNDQNSADKVKEIRKLLKKQSNYDQDYKSIIGQADNQYNSRKYNDARDLYAKANALNPDDMYPKNRLSVVDSILAGLYSKNKKAYDDLISNGDKKFANKEYDGAIKDYTAAKQLLPKQTYPQKQIDAINAALAAEKKKKEDAEKANADKYNALIKKADDLMSKTDYSNASSTYNQALGVKPDEPYAKLQKEKADKLQAGKLADNLKKQKEKNYNDTLKIGDDAFKAKDYQTALKFYNFAKNIKPEDKYPGKKIDEINQIVKQKATLVQDRTSKEKDRKEKPEGDQKVSERTSPNAIDNLVSDAEELEKNGNYDKASKLYMNVSEKFREKRQLGKALDFLKKALGAFKTKGDKAGEASALNEVGSVYYDSGQYKLAVTSYNEAIELKKETGDIKGAADVYSEIGEVYENTYQVESAINAYNEALTIRQQLGDNKGVSTVCNQLGNVYYNQNDFKQSVQFFSKALEVADKINDKGAKGGLLNSLGVVYYRMGNYEEAIKFYDKSIAISKETGNKKGVSLSYNNLGNINFDWNKYEKAIEYYEKSLSLKRELNFEEGMAVSLYNIGNSYLEMNNYLKANEYLNSGLEIAMRLGFREIIQLSYKSLSKMYELTKDFRNAMSAYKSFVSYIGPGMISEGQFSEMTSMYERESRLIKKLRHELEKQKLLTDFEAMQKLQKQRELQFKDLELKNNNEKMLKQRIMLMFTLICLGFAGMLALQFFRRYKEKKQYSEVIGFQKKQITDSIEYASRIQKAVLPPVDMVNTIFPESFVLNLPKDIVSGDYFYVLVKDNKVYVAVADCTGHGVPGAFMSMLGMSLIKEVIMKNDNITANEVLDKLRDALINALHQTGRDDEAKDGMDIALCVIDHEKNYLEYSGANNSCYIIRDNNIIELKPDRMPIGIHPIIKPFNFKVVSLQAGDVIYLFSDGFRDQIGEESLKKFKVGQFNQMLVEIHSLPVAQQPEVLRSRHLEWRGNMEQTDDILIVGIKV